MSTIEKNRKQIDDFEQQHEEAEENGTRVCLPDNGRDPEHGCGRFGSLIIYGKDHPVELFLKPDERKGRPPAPSPI